MNLYVHFPFCRRKCSYCALHSRAGSTPGERAEYVQSIIKGISLFSADAQDAADAPLQATVAVNCDPPAQPLNFSTSQRLNFSTVYFGGGSPGLCELGPLLDALAPYIRDDTEFTMELHPLDVTKGLLDRLAAGGVNRISMGVQSLDNGVLAAMGRGYSRLEAERAFAQVRDRFENAGIDLIVGYPGERGDYAVLAKWGLAHCSVYSLILEERTALAALVSRGKVALPDDDAVMNRIREVSRFLAGIGLERYEISNYARPGRECRHNLATWRGEDYIGLGDGACGRIGLQRTRNGAVVETVTPEFDLKERTIFRLRTREGLDARLFPEWRGALDEFVAEGLLTGSFPHYRLTERGTEVCDTILENMV